MPLFVDPKARERLTFPDDCPIEELRGEWIEVRESIGSAEWREFDAGRLTVGPGDDGVRDWQAAFSGVNGLRRLALWITGTSFCDLQDKPYPAQNVADRMRWLGALWPPAGVEIDALLSEYIDRAWSSAQVVPHPKAEASSDPDQTAS